MTDAVEADICIIGGGSAGLSLAAGAAQLGRNVVLFEKGEMGGDCLNYGCVPSKALLTAAAAAQSARDGAKFGVSAEPSVNFATVMDHVHSVIAAIAPIDSQERFEGLGVTVVRAMAKFTGPRELEAEGKKYSAKHFVIATGSSPFVPPIDGLGDIPYFTNENLFENRELPERLIVLGGGPIGIEMAQAHQRLGSSVVVVEGQSILNREDPETVEIVRERLMSEGIELLEGSFASKVTRADGGIHLTLANGKTVQGTHILVAVGRKPNIDGLGLEAAGIATNKRGIEVDARLRTTNGRVYAAGDVAGGLQFTHLAGDHASTLVRSILFKMPAKRRDDLCPRVTYCDPEIASVGLTEAEAREKHGDEFKIARWEFTENDRAQTESRTDGFIKVVTNPKGKILGATIVGKSAGDHLGIWSYALANGDKISSFTNYMAPYPTRGEVSKRAGGAYFTPTLFSDRTRTVIKLLSIFD